MTSLLIAFLFVLLAPLFLANWRVSILGLACQGILLLGMASRLRGGEPSASNMVEWLDLGLLRGIIVPATLYRVLLSRRAPDRNDVLPPNMLAWAAAVGLAVLSFRLASALVPQDGDGQMLVAVTGSAVLLGFLVLATQTAVFSQVVGVLRLENALALFELGAPGSSATEGYLGLHIAQAVVFAAAIPLLRYFLLVAPVTAVPEPVEPDDD